MFLARDSRRPLRRLATVVILALCVTAVPAATAVADRDHRAADWPVGGRDAANTRWNPFEEKINSSNVANLAVKWTVHTRGEISATPAVVDGFVYFPDWAGYLTKVNAHSGRVIWSRRISDYTGVAGNISRVSPAVSRGLVYLGDQGGALGAGARLLAIDSRTGDLVWSKLVESHPAAQLTQSPMVFDGVVYQGVSSVEFALAGDPDYECCTFRGSVLALDARTGRIRWKTHTVPDNGSRPGGYSGASVWGGTPAECLSPDNHKDSVLALDMRTGAIEWSAGPELFDDWNGGCLPGFPPDNCPDNPGPDYDFGAGPQLFTARIGGHPRQVVGAGQKSGQYWLFDAGTGEILWSAAAGPGGVNGGIQWGTATDGKRIYVAEANFENRPWQLPNGQTITWGSFAALEPSTGRILWQTADPTQGIDTAAVTTAGGVMYAGSLTGRMFALDAATGEIRWDFQGQGPVAAGPAVVDGTVYWGNGYPDRLNIPSIPSPSVLYAFSVPRD